MAEDAYDDGGDANRGIARDADVTALTGLETLFLGALFKTGADLTLSGARSGGTAVAKWLNDEAPMASAVEASWSDGTAFLFALSILNVEMHGGYIERVWLAEPEQRTPAVLRRNPQTRSVGLDSGRTVVPDWVDASLPVWVPAGESVRLTVSVPREVLARRQVPTVKIGYAFSMCGGRFLAKYEGDAVRYVNTRFRDGGPAFLPPAS